MTLSIDSDSFSGSNSEFILLPKLHWSMITGIHLIPYPLPQAFFASSSISKY